MQRLEKGAFGKQTLIQRYAIRSSLMNLSEKLPMKIFEETMLQNPADGILPLANLYEQSELKALRDIREGTAYRAFVR